jgi:hypothetical protein
MPGALPAWHRLLAVNHPATWLASRNPLAEAVERIAGDARRRLTPGQAEVLGRTGWRR